MLISTVKPRGYGTSSRNTEAKVLELGPVVLAIVEGAASSLTSRLLTRKKDPINIRTLVDEASRELKVKNKELEASISDIALALQSLRSIIGRLPEFDVRGDDRVTYRPGRESDLGDVLYRLDEEIALLRGSVKGEEQSDSSLSRLNLPKQEAPAVLPRILEGLDEEISSLRGNRPRPSTPEGNES